MAGVELTRVFTVEVTFIGDGNSLDEFITKEKCAKRVKNLIGVHLEPDDVLVTNVQDFVREVPDADM